MLDIDELNRKCLVGDYTTFKSSEANNDQTKYEKLEMKIEQILEDNKKLNIAVSSLSSTNNALEKEILELKGKMNSLEKQTSISEITTSTRNEDFTTTDITTNVPETDVPRRKRKSFGYSWYLEG